MFKLVSISSKRRLLLGIAALLAVFSVGVWAYHKWAAAKPPAAVVGSWIGVSDGDVFTYRLVLESQGTGAFGFQLTDQSPDLYTISAWGLNANRLRFQLQATPSASEVVSLEGSVAGTRLLLVVTGRDWKHRVEMCNEQKFFPRIVSLRNAMDEMQQQTNSVGLQR